MKVEIKDPRVLFKGAQGVTQVLCPRFNKIQLSAPSWEGALLEYRGESVFEPTMGTLSSEPGDGCQVHRVRRPPDSPGCCGKVSPTHCSSRLSPSTEKQWLHR